MTVAEKQKNKEQFKDKATEDRPVETLLTGPQFGFLVIAAHVLPYFSLSNDLHGLFQHIVKIVPGHRLIKTGPQYQAHPSYTGALLCMVAFQGALFDQHWAWIQTLLPFDLLP